MIGRMNERTNERMKTNQETDTEELISVSIFCFMSLYLIVDNKFSPALYLQFLPRSSSQLNGATYFLGFKCSVLYSLRAWGHQCHSGFSSQESRLQPIHGSLSGSIFQYRQGPFCGPSGLDVYCTEFYSLSPVSPFLPTPFSQPSNYRTKVASKLVSPRPLPSTNCVVRWRFSKCKYSHTTTACLQVFGGFSSLLAWRVESLK